MRNVVMKSARNVVRSAVSSQESCEECLLVVEGGTQQSAVKRYTTRGYPLEADMRHQSEL